MKCPYCGGDVFEKDIHFCCKNDSPNIILSASFEFGQGKIKPKGWLKKCLNLFHPKKQNKQNI